VILIRDGIVESQLLSGSFKGYIDIPQEYLEINFKPTSTTLTRSSKLPQFKIHGTFSDIQVSVELKEVIEEKAKKFLDKGSAIDRLKGLLK
jgi:uncharacterized protein involved in outer membrane biogenesis